MIQSKSKLCQESAGIKIVEAEVEMAEVVEEVEVDSEIELTVRTRRIRHH